MSLKPCSIDNKNTLKDAALSLNKSGHRIVVITKENIFWVLLQMEILEEDY